MFGSSSIERSEIKLESQSKINFLARKIWSTVSLLTKILILITRYLVLSRVPGTVPSKPPVTDAPIILTAILLLGFVAPWSTDNRSRTR